MKLILVAATPRCAFAVLSHDIVSFWEDFLPRMDTDSHGLERGEHNA
jgi:hypothetical protein